MIKCAVATGLRRYATRRAAIRFANTRLFLCGGYRLAPIRHTPRRYSLREYAAFLYTLLFVFTVFMLITIIQLVTIINFAKMGISSTGL